MKIRNGFVSNSSSSSYILDLRKPGVQEIVNSVISQGIQLPQSVDRCSAIAIGEDVMYYAKEWIEELGEYGYEDKNEDKNDPDNYGNWIIKCCEELGTENTVFIRISDEGMGGECAFDMSDPSLIYSEREYH